MGTSCFPGTEVGVPKKASMLKNAVQHVCGLSEGSEHKSYGGQTITGITMFTPNPYKLRKEIREALRAFSMFICNECLINLSVDELRQKSLKSKKMSQQLKESSFFNRALLMTFRQMSGR